MTQAGKRARPRGVLTAIVTPFGDDGRLDLGALDALVERQIEAGVSGIVAIGTTGESPSLDDREREAVFARVAAKARGRVMLVGGGGTNSFAHSVHQLEQVRGAGFDAALVVTPYYNKPSADGLVAHYLGLMEKVDLPIVAYNVPSRTGCDLRPEVVERIASHPNLLAVKEATGEMARVLEIKQRLGDRIAVLSGDDATFLPLLACGGDGVIATTANVDPAGMVAVWKAWKGGDCAGALAAQLRMLDLYKAMFVESNPGPAKYALAKMGLIRPVIRLPMVLPQGANAARIDEVLSRHFG